MRGIYGQDRYLVGQQPVELRDVSAGGGIWLGFFAFLGWTFAKGLSAGIGTVVDQALTRKKSTGG